MKRFVLFFLALSLLLSLGAVCLAAEAPLSVSDAEVSAGQTVYLAVTLDESVTANTIGVQCEFDKELLTALPELCTWEKTALLSAFDTDNMGAWAGAASVDLKGKLCVLAFQVKEGVAFSKTKVVCTVILKDDAKEMGTYTAEGIVTCACDHSYGDWTDGGNMGHVRVCSVCGGKNTQSHDWDDGTEKPGEGNMTTVTYTCLVCRAQTALDVPTGGEHQKPTQPEDAEQGTLIVTPTVPGQDASEPGQTVQPGGQGEDDVTPDHTVEETPATDRAHTDAQTPAETDHTHTAGGSASVNVWVILGVLALAVAAAVLFLKKKR